MLDNIGPRVNPHNSSTGNADDTSKKANDSGKGEQQQGLEPDSDGTYPWHDNFNLSPGHDAVVFFMNRKGVLEMHRKVWGLVTKPGTAKSPVPRGPSKHFANLMFNARSDTLCSKPTFSRLLNEGKTCLVAFDGFFEWKADALGGGKGKKQPYFVYGNKDTEQKSEKSQRPYLLMAGLWTSVSTGYSPPEGAKIDTFTLLTTEVCDPLKWLHSRMPVCVWDEALAMEWLQKPTQKTLEALDGASIKTHEDFLQWHPVTTQMSSTKFRSSDAIKPIPKPKSVKSFFAPVGKLKQNDSKSKVAGGGQTVASVTENPKHNKANTTTTSPTAVSKRPATTKLSPVKSNKKSKANPSAATKGSITSFFSPKKSK